MKLNLHEPDGRALIYGIVGSLLLLAAVGLIAMTIRGELDFRMAVNHYGGQMIDLADGGQPRPGQHGQAARIVGTPQVVEAPLDPDFNLRVDTPVLVRHVEMFRWRKISFGAGSHYDMDWVEQSPRSDAENLSGRHANPPFPIKGMTVQAAQVKLGGFQLSPALVRAIPGGPESVAPPLTSLPPNMAATFSRFKGYLVTSEYPSAPMLGDIRISWTRVPLQPLTVFARIDGKQLVATPSASDGRGFVMDVGNVSVLNMFPDLPIPPHFVWLDRIAAVVLAAIGLLLLDWSRRRRLDGILAVSLALLVVGAVAGVMWMGHDVRLTTVWLVLAVLGLGVASWRLRHHWRPVH